tara:strand:+ start:228 stop:758 length:531 start_codon:yes stop_codon:yes gene_type:complete
MKKIIIVLAVIISACNPQVEKETAKEQKGAGFFLPLEGEKFIVASDSLTEVWMNYIKAHNDRDLETIMSMNTDSISIEDQDGRLIQGNEMHIAALESWFTAEDPKWEVYWAMPYKAVNGGEEWIIAGHQVTVTIDGKEKVQLQMIDGQIENGKIKQFYIYSRGIPEPPKNDLDKAE